MAPGQAVRRAPAVIALAALIALAACGGDATPTQSMTSNPAATAAAPSEGSQASDSELVLLTLRVVDATGASVTGARVRLGRVSTTPSGSLLVEYEPERSMDETGSLRYGPYAADQVLELHADPPAGRFDLLDARVWDAKPGDITLTLQPGFVVVGRVVDDMGHGSAYAHVWLFDPPSSSAVAQADVEGRFRTAPVPTVGAMLYALPGYQGSGPTYYIDGDESYLVNEHGRVPVRPGGPEVSIPLTTRPKR